MSQYIVTIVTIGAHCGDFKAHFRAVFMDPIGKIVFRKRFAFIAVTAQTRAIDV